MCEACPSEVLDLAEKIAAYASERNWVIAGGLHIAIEDENVHDDHIRWCLDTQELDQRSREFGEALLAMPVPSRHMAVRLAWDNLLPDILADAREGRVEREVRT